MPTPPYRGRLAPSPTGFLHLGHARTFAAAAERAAHGTLIFRMEDLDPDRCRADYFDAALEDLRWLGLTWQEGPGIGGPCAPYTQSQRLSVYRAALRSLLARGFLYPCRCSRKDLVASISAPHEAQTDDEPLYPGTCRPASPFIATDAEDDLLLGRNWRFRVPDGEAIEFTDLNLGPQRFIAGRDFGDFVLWRRDGVPSYQLACVADDEAMRITEVVRGADLLKSTARQILLARALDYTSPAWFHCALITDAAGTRLAKRHDALAIRTLRARGFTPAQILSGDIPPES
ncbi:MAG: tRNA glutamyl-Q(34) synthetase GluQRS [Terracidiphilus sp.]|nr:tRNA glutamyl-Q(34) synthetase GluQRS [Terracidiphilus sp.]